MILTRKRLLVDIFLTSRLSKSLAFCEFANVNFEPWAKPLLTIFIFFVGSLAFLRKRATFG